jgi:hypothetical protein
MMNESNKYIRFDWAAKRLLRDKANFDVLEGFLKVLLNEDIKIMTSSRAKETKKTSSTSSIVSI